MKYSKNMYWWIVALVALLGCVINAMFDQWILSVACGVAFLISGSFYLEKRKAGQ
jgi:hypothetical protein